jgi:hypothetical protein
MTSFSLVLSPELKRKIKYDPEAAKFVPRLVNVQVQDVKTQLQALTLIFRPDGTFVSASSIDRKTSEGTWNLNRDKLTMHYRGIAKPGPPMTVLAQKKKIKATFSGEGFGTLTGYLIRIGK